MIFEMETEANRGDGILMFTCALLIFTCYMFNVDTYVTLIFQNPVKNMISRIFKVGRWI